MARQMREKSAAAIDTIAATAYLSGVLTGVNMPETVGVREVRSRLAELVDRAERGEIVVITRSGREVARLGPPERREQRRPGRMKGRMWAAPDWDETPPELIDTMEGKGEAW